MYKKKDVQRLGKGPETRLGLQGSLFLAGVRVSFRGVWRFPAGVSYYSVRRFLHSTAFGSLRW
eukprot:8541464-Pyramimonas_sp.AAC.1